MQSILKSSIAAVVIMLGTAIAAEARPVLVTSDLNVRTGPGTQHPSVGVIRGGSTAEVGRCFDGWCEIAWGPLRGFSSQAYLDGGGPQYAPPPPPYYAPRPYYRPYYNPYRPWRYHRHW